MLYSFKTDQINGHCFVSQQFDHFDSVHFAFVIIIHLDQSLQGTNGTKREFKTGSVALLLHLVLLAA